MPIRETIANTLVQSGRSIGESVGLELAVELSEHSIELELEKPDEDTRAWDPSMYSGGNVFVEGYANPIKPRVNYHQELETPDTIDVEEGNKESEESEEKSEDEPHLELISSGRYRDYMRQDLISQLLTPDAQWKLIAYAVLAMCVLQFLGIIITLWATGSFA